ncbi:hypothetical protein [Sinosporangium siamense]|uniref:hypothetical protein n=1 Tax=Sinosporangium siamense TaxID=1367973 RepID=UPI001EF227D9|nr:hypothetical protein [Sinosporangium siamense]
MRGRGHREQVAELGIFTRFFVWEAFPVVVLVGERRLGAAHDADHVARSHGGGGEKQIANAVARN